MSDAGVLIWKHRDDCISAAKFTEHLKDGLKCADVMVYLETSIGVGFGWSQEGNTSRKEPPHATATFQEEGTKSGLSRKSTLQNAVCSLM